MPRTAIAQIAKMIGRELDTGVGPSEEALAAGPILAEAGATTEIVGGLLAEAHRKHPDDRVIERSRSRDPILETATEPGVDQGGTRSHAALAHRRSHGNRGYYLIGLDVDPGHGLIAAVRNPYAPESRC